MATGGCGGPAPGESASDAPGADTDATSFQAELMQQLADQGIDATQVKDAGDKLLYQGDIAFDKAPLFEAYRTSHATPSRAPLQRYYQFKQCSGWWLWEKCTSYRPVDQGRIALISVRLDTPGLQPFLTAALANWNTAGSGVYLRQVTTGGDIVVSEEACPRPCGYTGYAYASHDGIPGEIIRIITDWHGWSGRDVIVTLTHELGHTIGLAHTSDPSGEPSVHIDRTPDQESASIMDWMSDSTTRMTDADRVAVRMLYPLTRDPDLTFMADVTGDGKKDLVVVAANGINVAVTNPDGRSFGQLSLWHHEFSQEQGWQKSMHPIMVGDINGDRKADIVGIGHNGVTVAIANGAGFGSQWWSNDFCYNNGWRVDMHPRILADVNGDRMADLVGFANGATVVGVSTGAGFVSQNWSSDFTYNNGWRVNMHPRLLADVNGDGKADVVGFANASTVVGISTGSSFVSQNWSSDFTYNNGWRVDMHPRLIGDVNGDGFNDIVGFANGATVVGLNTGSSFVSQAWTSDFTYNNGWRVNMHPRLVGDVTGDGKADIVGFANGATVVGVSNGSSFGSMSWSTDFCYNNGWRVDQHPRMLADLRGQGRLDLVALGTNEWTIGQSTDWQFVSLLGLQYR